MTQRRVTLGIWRNVAAICSHVNHDMFDLYKHLFEGERLPESSLSDDQKRLVTHTTGDFGARDTM